MIPVAAMLATSCAGCVFVFLGWKAMASPGEVKPGIRAIKAFAIFAASVLIESGALVFLELDKGSAFLQGYAFGSIEMPRFIVAVSYFVGLGFLLFVRIFTHKGSDPVSSIIRKGSTILLSIMVAGYGSFLLAGFAS